MTLRQDYPIKHFRTQRAFDIWLSRNAEKSGVWLKFAKKGSRETSIAYCKERRNEAEANKRVY